MISIVVSSYRDHLFSNFEKNIQSTIGNTPYEIIRIKNSGELGICEAYNKGGLLANFPFLIFCHEDILFHTKNWGNLLIQAYQYDPSIGLLGVIGSRYKALFYSGWANDTSLASAFMIGTHYGQSNLKKIKNGVINEIAFNKRVSIPNIFFETNIVNEEVVVLDGMFLATQKKVFNEFKFDEKTFKGFHCYDLDYSMQILTKYKVVVNYNILVEHLSAGSFNEDWMIDTRLFSNKWLHHLPCENKNYSSKEKAKFEYKAYEQFMRINGQNKKTIWQSTSFLFESIYIKRIGVFCWLLLMSNVVTKIIKISKRKFLKSFQ